MLKILLLCGGKGRERDISLNSVRSVYDHIKGLETVESTVVFVDTDNQKYQIDELYLYSNTSDDFRFLLKSEITPLTEEAYLACLSECDLVFPVIHGVGGEDGVLQKELEGIGVSFVGSPSLACEKMYNKRNAEEQILVARGMTNIPKIYVSGNPSEYTTIVENFVNEQGEVCLKPSEGGSSFGVEFATNIKEAFDKTQKLLEEEKYDEIVIEKKCKGKEFTIIILDNGGTPVALMPTEIEIVDNGTFDRRRKYMSTTEVHYHCPARFEEVVISRIRTEAEALFSFVGARDFLRIDGWVLDDGSVYFSDFNPISGMEQNSFIFQQATKIGFTHITLLEYILRNACSREDIVYPEKQNSNIKKRRVNVLLGGITSERQVSLLSGTNVWMKLLHSKKYAPVPHILTRESDTDIWKVSEIPYSFALLHTTEEIIDQIENCSIDVDIVNSIRSQLGLESKHISLDMKWLDLHGFVRETKKQGAYLFVGLHGGFGENGGIQAVLEDIGVDYNGSGAEASALCMDKYQTGCKVTELALPQLRTCKKIVANLDVAWEELIAEIGEPIIAKPNSDGCSTGVIKLTDGEDLRKYVDCCRTGNAIPKNTFENQPEVIAMSEQYDRVLFEEYIKTDSIVIKNGELLYNSVTGWVEITIGVLEKHGQYHAFNPSVTIAENDILSVEEKFQGGVGINLTPPPERMISNTLKNRIKYYAENVAQKCGVEDYCRIDMFANNKTGEVIVIEINSLPGLSPSTVLFQQAAKEIPTLSPLALLERIMESGGSDMNGLTFKEIVNCTGGVSTYDGEDFPVPNIKFDSRENMKSTMFVAFVTDRDNGHKYVSMAANKGAVAALVSEETPSNIPIIKVTDTQRAFQDIARFYRSKFSIPVIALTGSNGKTTVKDMLTAVLSSKYKVLATEKNLNNELGVPQTLLKLDGNHEVAVIEMGMNHYGEIRTSTDVAKPDIAIITKIGTAHMGNLGGTRTDVFKAKMEIVEGLRENGTLVLCGDDDLLSAVESNKHDIMFCGLSDDGRNIIYASDISQFWSGNEYGLTFLVHHQGDEYSCFLPVLGKHNVQNALLALTVGIKLNIPMKDAVEALRFYSRSSMRLETATIRGVKFIKDYYNASPESAKAALDTLAELETDGSRIAILGDLLELGEKSAELHKELAEHTIGRADHVFYVGEYDEAFLSGRVDAHCFVTKEKLNFALLSEILSGELSYGDVVLIKGSNGVKMWEQYEFLHRLLEQGSAISAQTRLLVDVDALKHNYAAIKSYVGESVQVVPVVKADAYGTGANLLANIYNDCNFFAVADLCEAEELRVVMPNAKFLVLYQPLPREADWIAERGEYVVMSVGDADFVRALNKAAIKANKNLSVHIEIDTGMSRLGVLVDDCEELAKIISTECTNLTVDGIFTHYSSADMYAPEDLEFTAIQTERFKKAVGIVENLLGQIPFKHASASAAIFNLKAELFNMVRPGYILRGYYPCDEIKDKVFLKPSLKYVTQVTQIKEFDDNENASVSYGRHFVTKKKTRLAAIPVGYSDGIMRKLSNVGAFVIKGQLAPIVGNVTMDYTMVDVTDIDPMVWVGDEVAIFDNVNMTIERMAELCGTIGYEIITNIRDKTDRIESF